MGKLVTDLATVAVVRARVLELENRVRELEQETTQLGEYNKVLYKDYDTLREAAQVIKTRRIECGFVYLRTIDLVEWEAFLQALSEGGGDSCGDDGR